MENVFAKTIFVIAIIKMAGLIHAAEFGPNSANISNPYLPAKIGIAYIYAGYGDKIELYQYLDVVGIETVEGVKCVRANSIDNIDNDFASLWIAQDISGDVYILKFWDEENPTPIVIGKDNAVLLMPATPKVGDKIFADDETVLEIGITVPQLSTGLGPFTNCLKTQEEDGDIKYYAPGIGEVKKEYSGVPANGHELKEIIITKSGAAVIPLFD